MITVFETDDSIDPSSTVIFCIKPNKALMLPLYDGTASLSLRHFIIFRYATQCQAMISESDWKKFKKIKEVALERLCSEAVADYAEAVSDPKLTNHGKHLYLYRLAITYDKQIALLFDDHSRSKAIIQLLLLRDKKLVTDEELALLSDELKAATKPKSA